MWLSIISFLGGPVVSGLISAYKLHLQATTATTTIAADLAGKEIAAESIEAQAATQLKIAQIGHPFEPEKLAFYVTLIYYAKCLIWDKVLGLGVTDSVEGPIGVWAGLIMSFYFGQRTFQNVMQIWKQK